MALSFRAASVLLFFCSAACFAQLKAPPKLQRAPNTVFELGGPIHDRVAAVQDNWLMRAPEQNPAMLGMFADRDRQPYRNLLPWSGEFAGKYLTASTQVLRLTHDPALQKYIQSFVDKLVALQDEDGYLGPFPRSARLVSKAPNCDGTWDAWGHYHIMLGLLLWNEQAQDAKALRCAEKIGDLLCDHFLGKNRHVFDMGSPDQNQAVIHGLCLLYEKSPKAQYLELARQIVGEFEIPGAGDYRRTALAGKEFYATPKPRWESLHAILGLAELYHITGDAENRKAFEHIWWSIDKLDRHNNGGFSSGEQAVGNPYDPRPIETCCTIAWIASSVEMLKMTGDSIVADEIELSTLNSVVGAHSPDCKWTTYNTPMNGLRVPNTTDIAFQIRPGSEQLNCCSVNAARGFGMISEWAVMSEAGRSPGLVLNYYGPCELKTEIGGVAVMIKEQTEYPREGHIELAINPERSTRFALKLRIPHWSQTTKLKVNGDEAVVKSGGYCMIERQWHSGDRVTLDLDLSLRAWAGEKQCAGKVSLYRGPILLAWQSDNPADKAAPPVLDLAALQPKLLENANGSMVLLEAADGENHRIKLRDFGGAGQNHAHYYSWLVAKSAKIAEFSQLHPLRDLRIEPASK